MGRLILLDATPLGEIAKPDGKPTGDRAKAWVSLLMVQGNQVGFSEVTDYEIRRELTRHGAHAGIARLDRLAGEFTYYPITTEVMRRAAVHWAVLRNAGAGTSDPKSIDADCILAAQAVLLARLDLHVVVATANVKHFTRFQDVRSDLWSNISGSGL